MPDRRELPATSTETCQTCCCWLSSSTPSSLSSASEDSFAEAAEELARALRFGLASFLAKASLARVASYSFFGAVRCRFEARPSLEAQGSGREQLPETQSATATREPRLAGQLAQLQLAGLASWAEQQHCYRCQRLHYLKQQEQVPGPLGPTFWNVPKNSSQ
jgi:hypothetical protein